MTCLGHAALGQLYCGVGEAVETRGGLIDTLMKDDDAADVSFNSELSGLSSSSMCYNFSAASSFCPSFKLNRGSPGFRFGISIQISS